MLVVDTPGPTPAHVLHLPYQRIDRPVFPFDDSDVYKAIEAASYALAIKPDPALDARIDELIAKVAADTVSGKRR